MYFTASRVFLYPCKFITSCLYQLINFLGNFLASYGAYRTSTRLLVRVICSWLVTIPITSAVLSIYGSSQNKIIRQFGITAQVHQLMRYARIVQKPQELLDNCMKIDFSNGLWKTPTMHIIQLILV